MRHRIPIPEGDYLLTDAFNKVTGEPVEAKASPGRVYVRSGLGQVLDYSRFLEHEKRALLLPVRPSDDLSKLLRNYRVAVIGKTAAISFAVMRPLVHPNLCTCC